jgi:hypothetical protein
VAELEAVEEVTPEDQHLQESLISYYISSKIVIGC